MNHLVTPPERQDSIQLTDGRRLAWFEWGPPTGRPVLFCTGAGMSGWLGFGARELPDLGLKLLALDRPGLGLSDPDPHKTLSSWADDVRELIHTCQLEQGLAVGFSQGAPFAFALAAQGLVDAIAIVSGQDDLTHSGLQAHLHPDVAGMVAAVRQDPTAFEQHFSQFVSAEGLWQLIMDMSAEGDRQLYASDKFAPAYRRALEEGFSQGNQGYVRDLRNTFSSWPFQLEAIRIPVDLWYGKLDSSPVHSPDLGATLAARLPDASFTVVAEAGSSLLWTHAWPILSTLKSRIN